MTLKEKFKQCKNKRNTYYIIPIIEDIEQLEQITEKFTVEFAEWINNSLYIIPWRRGSITTEELLEIFKKEYDS